VIFKKIWDTVPIRRVEADLPRGKLPAGVMLWANCCGHDPWWGNLLRYCRYAPQAQGITRPPVGGLVIPCWGTDEVQERLHLWWDYGLRP
jgi:hypothetical protein